MSTAQYYKQQGDHYYLNGQYDLAIQYYTKSLQLDSLNIDAYLQRGNAFDDIGNYKKAIRDFKKIISLRPNDPDAYANLGYVYDNMGAYAEAVESYTKALSFQPYAADVFYHRGLAYKNMGTLAKAIDDFKQAIRLHPKQAQVYYGAHINCGDAYFALGNFKQAMIFYTNVIEVNPNFTLAYERRSKTYRRLGLISRATEDENTVRLLTNGGYIRIAQPDRFVAMGSAVKEKATRLLDKGVAEKRAGNYFGAKRYYYEAIKLNPLNLMGYVSLAKITYLTGEQLESFINYCRAAHLNLIMMATSKSNLARWELHQTYPEETINTLSQIHPLAPYLLIDSNIPRHLAHTVFDFTSEYLQDPEKRYVANAYREHLSGQNRASIPNYDDSNYKVLGINILLEKLRWDEMDSIFVEELYY